MGIHTTDAIVLRRHLFRETSVVVSCLTDRFGKIKGLVKGLRMHPSRHRSAMEPMTVNRILFYDAHTSHLHLVSSCELLQSFSALSNDLETMRCAAYFVDLVDAVVPLEEPHPAIYRLLREALERLTLTAGDLTEPRVHFTLRLLRLTGFQPQLDQCAACAGPVSGEGFWSVGQGGLLCRRCLHQDPHAEPATPRVLEALASLSDTDAPVPLDAAVAPIVRQRLESFLRWRLEQPLKTLSLA